MRSCKLVLFFVLVAVEVAEGRLERVCRVEGPNALTCYQVLRQDNVLFGLTL